MKQSQLKKINKSTNGYYENKRLPCIPYGTRISTALEFQITTRQAYGQVRRRQANEQKGKGEAKQASRQIGM